MLVTKRKKGKSGGGGRKARHGRSECPRCVIAISLEGRSRGQGVGT